MRRDIFRKPTRRKDFQLLELKYLKIVVINFVFNDRTCKFHAVAKEIKQLLNSECSLPFVQIHSIVIFYSCDFRDSLLLSNVALLVGGKHHLQLYGHGSCNHHSGIINEWRLYTSRRQGQLLLLLLLFPASFVATAALHTLTASQGNGQQSFCMKRWSIFTKQRDDALTRNPSDMRVWFSASHTRYETKRRGDCDVRSSTTYPNKSSSGLFLQLSPIRFPLERTPTGWIISYRQYIVRRCCFVFEEECKSGC